MLPGERGSKKNLSWLGDNKVAQTKKTFPEVNTEQFYRKISGKQRLRKRKKEDVVRKRLNDDDVRLLWMMELNSIDLN